MKSGFKKYLEGFLPLLLISVICYFLKESIELLNIAMLYLLPILFTATRYDRMLTFFVSVCAALLFDVLFVPPVFHLTVHNMEYLLSFFIMIIVGQLVSTLALKAAKAKELETSEKLYEAVLGSLSHELRTPLAVVIGSTSSILSGELELSNAEKSELCDSAYQSALKMQELVENLLMSARTESNSLRPIIETCSVADIISSALVKIEKKYDKIANFTIEEDLHSIRNDASLLEQAYFNIIDNAFKYGQSINVSIKSSGDEIIVDVSNDGTLPSDKEMQTIGNKFTRLSNSMPHSGNGLGLFISKRLFEVLGVQFKLYVSNDLFCIKTVLR